jgi:hypothetical protein
VVIEVPLMSVPAHFWCHSAFSLKPKSLLLKCACGVCMCIRVVLSPSPCDDCCANAHNPAPWRSLYRTSSSAHHSQVHHKPASGLLMRLSTSLATSWTTPPSISPAPTCIETSTRTIGRAASKPLRSGVLRVLRRRRRHVARHRRCCTSLDRHVTLD